MCIDVHSQEQVSFGGRLIVMALTIVYTTNVGINERELGFADGVGGTTPVDVFTGVGSSYPQYFTQLGSKVLFEATDAADGRELWVTDGTTTTLLTNINPGAGNAFDIPDLANLPLTFQQFTPYQPAVLGNLMFFAANDGTHGVEPWVTDGTPGGTHILLNINTTGGANGPNPTAGQIAFYPQYFTPLNGFMYFVASDGTTGPQIWKSDGTTTTQVTHLASSQGINYVTQSGGSLFFNFYNGTSGSLYVMDGTATGAHALTVDDPGATVSPNPGPTNLTDINGTLYFQQADDIHGAELWKADVNGAHFVADIAPGADPNPGFPDTPHSSAPVGFVGMNNKVYFVANNTPQGFELWVSDGTSGNAQLVTEINTTNVNGGYSFFGAIQLVVYNNALYFDATNNGVDFELWKSDGVVGHPATEFNINTGTSSTPYALQVIDGNLYFAALATGDNTPSLFKYDGTNPPAKISPADYGGDSVESFSFIPQNAVTAQMVLASATEHVAIASNATIASFTDSNAGDAAADFAATIIWGDGTNSAGTIVGSAGSFSIQGGHTYADEGNFTVSVSLVHTADSATTTVSGSVAVAENDFLTAHPATFSATSGSAFTGTVATFDDSDHVTPAADLVATINWGDATTTAGTVSGSNGSFTVSGTHTYGTTGSKTVTVTLTDDAPGTATATATSTANVAPPNAPPIAQPGSASGNEDTPITAQAAATDVDNTQAQLTYSLVGANGGALHGTVSMDTHGAFTYSPATNYNGPDSFSFKANDGTSDSNTATESITINAVNDAPAFANFGAAHTSATEQIFVRLNTAATVHDVELDALNAGAGDYLGASLIIGRGGSPNPNPEDTFAFGGAGMTFTVNTVNHTLLAGGQQFATYSIPLSGALAGTIAVNFNSLNTTATTALVNNVLQHIVYENLSDTPPASVTMHWTFNDGNQGGQGSGGNLSDTANRIVDITPVNDAPVITSDGGGDTATLSVVERTTAVTTVVAPDPDGPSVTYSIVGGADAGKFQIDGATGALSFVAAPNFDIPTDTDHNNSYLVQVRASDGSLSDDQSITVQVTDNPAINSTVHWDHSVDAGSHPAGWVPQGTGDFNADGTSDLAWYNSMTNDVEIWKLSNGAWAGSSDAGSHPAGYQPVGFGDYNGDHTSDVLWYNPTTRDVDLWKISNGQWAGSVDIGTHPAGSQPVLSGDFNGDGTSDIAWYNPTTNGIDIWKISNGQWAGSVDVGAHPAGYQPVLAGDFNGDGTSDIAWYNPTTHDLDIWKIVNGQWAGSVDVGTHPAGWQPLGAADFNLDGTSDIAWYNPTTNNIDIWLIKNGQWAGSFDIGRHPGTGSGGVDTEGRSVGNPAILPVIAVGAGDFDHSGVADIMWQDKNTGHIDNWMLAYS
jgi:ELWxxDGT repeat protein